MKTEVKEITPYVAKELLKCNVNNRRVSVQVLDLYVKMMSQGLWKEAGDTIKISKSGRILDGQKRLMAVVKSGITIKIAIAYDLEDDVFDVIDIGQKRTSADSFFVLKIKNSNSVPSIIKQYILIMDNKRGGLMPKDRATNADILNIYHSDPDFWQDIASKSFSFYKDFSKILTPSVVGGYLAAFSKNNLWMAETFFYRLCTGDGANGAILLLRNRLIDDKTSLKKLPPTIKNALIIKAWNFFISGINPKQLKYTESSEDFPIIINK